MSEVGKLLHLDCSWGKSQTDDRNNTHGACPKLLSVMFDMTMASLKLLICVDCVNVVQLVMFAAGSTMLDSNVRLGPS